MALYDYEFDLGKGRRLQGRGPLGLAALGLLLAAFVGAIAVGGAFFVNGGADILRLISAVQKVF
jgi:hypothetical protein